MLVLWSGGCDSTLLIDRLLNEGRHRVRALTVEVPGVPAHREQRWARAEQKKRWAKRGFKFEHRTVSLAFDGGEYKNHAMPPQKVGPIQPQFWLGNALPWLTHDEDLAVGWIADEQIEARRVAFEALQRTSHKTGKLWTPFSAWRKFAIVDHLCVAGLYDVTWSCENPPAKPFLKECGQCAKCIERLTAEWQLETFSREALYDS